MQDISIETILVLSPLTTEEIPQANPCFECGNCCRNFYGKMKLGEAAHFIERGFKPYICPSRYQYDSIRSYPKDYPQNLYLYSENLENVLPDILESINEADPIVLGMEVEFAIIGECINHDTESNQCMDYENRPGFCRDFQVGSRQCNINRAQIGLTDTKLPVK